ncbi:hypothetical protein AHMF7616_02048 [Adhaeribacter pallidiroseus]|uniref:Uncharacterized protein n=1 Tax=Adhaeribacter pallidiroseus TaxID=2072847 RepID=A0A369QIM7_9BACT|nr:hypothetical protein AHMF7616_02048 [Adhaeribacter pallidiroseus]
MPVCIHPLIYQQRLSLLYFAQLIVRKVKYYTMTSRQSFIQQATMATAGLLAPRLTFPTLASP